MQIGNNVMFDLIISLRNRNLTSTKKKWNSYENLEMGKDKIHLKFGDQIFFSVFDLRSYCNFFLHCIFNQQLWIIVGVDSMRKWKFEYNISLHLWSTDMDIGHNTDTQTQLIIWKGHIIQCNYKCRCWTRHMSDIETRLIEECPYFVGFH